MKDIETFLKNFMASWQMAKIYEVKHPMFVNSLEQAYGNLMTVLGKKKELVVGIFGKELASGDNIFFDLSKNIITAIDDLEERGIEKITFYEDITKDELSNFIALLLAPKEDMKTRLQEYLHFMGIRNIVVGKIKTPTKSDEAKEEGSKTKLVHYENCLGEISQSLDSLVSEGAVDCLNLRFIASNIMENLIGNYQVFFKLPRAKSYDSVIFMHLLNVSILSMHFSYKLGFGRDDCIAISTAALFHDIGKLYIAKKIVHKAGALDEKEFSEMKSHTIIGAEMLAEHVDALTVLPAVVAFEHHLGYNLKGYPRASSCRRPHVASSIVSICDVYDALSQRRSYKRDYPPDVIYNLMMKDKDGKFSPGLLDKFFKIMGIWPRGTIVLLNDERVAIVREVNENDIFSPQIEIILPDSKEVIDLSKEESIKIKHSLNPLSEGKEYMGLI